MTFRALLVLAITITRHSPEQFLRFQSRQSGRQQIASAVAWDHLSRRLCLITSYLDAANLDPETKRVLDVALEMTRISLGLEDDFANGMIAKRLIELAKAGECNPDNRPTARTFVRGLTGRSYQRPGPPSLRATAGAGHNARWSSWVGPQARHARQRKAPGEGDSLAGA
jgi:hypothetical protein